MKKLSLILSLTFLNLTIAGMVLLPHANAAEGTCYLKAGTTDVFVIIYDLDHDGNQGAQIWQGRINQGESVKITTPHGRFRYEYNDRPDRDQPLSGGRDRLCSNLETVLVP